MILRYIAFSDQGEALARQVAGALGGEVTRSSKEYNAKAWTKDVFHQCDGMVFVGASGIAVRSIAPYLVNKTKDPAVVVMDEQGHFAVSLVSGHLGGANDLARQIASVTGAQPVITTATDARGIFSVDAWARHQGLQVLEPKSIVTISSALLAGQKVTLATDLFVQGDVPEGLELVEGAADVSVGFFHREAKLHLVPKRVYLGVGCRRDTPKENIQAAFESFCQETGLMEEAICQVASIDLKKDEKGLQEFCQGHQWEFVTFSAEELLAAPGEFTSSSFVQSITGVDNVCERSCVTAAAGECLLRKFSKDGVTMAAAWSPYEIDWRQ